MILSNNVCLQHGALSNNNLDASHSCPVIPKRYLMRILRALVTNTSTIRALSSTQLQLVHGAIYIPPQPTNLTTYFTPKVSQPSISSASSRISYSNRETSPKCNSFQPSPLPLLPHFSPLLMEPQPSGVPAAVAALTTAPTTLTPWQSVTARDG